MDTEEKKLTFMEQILRDPKALDLAINVALMETFGAEFRERMIPALPEIADAIIDKLPDTEHRVFRGMLALAIESKLGELVDGVSSLLAGMPEDIAKEPDPEPDRGAEAFDDIEEQLKNLAENARQAGIDVSVCRVDLKKPTSEAPPPADK